MDKGCTILYAAYSGEVLLVLMPDKRYVILVYAQGMKRTVVQRAANILDINEPNEHPQLAQQASLGELQRWLGSGAFERMSKHLSTNVIHARLVLQWKNIDDQWRTQSRLVVPGFKDLQASQLSTFAGTTSRWGQRKVNSIAVQTGGMYSRPM